MPSSCCYIKCSVECEEFDEEEALNGEKLGPGEDADEEGGEESEDMEDVQAMVSSSHPLAFCALDDMEKR